MGAVDREAPNGAGEVGTTPKEDDAKDRGGWGAGARVPSALAYDSEEERMGAMAPQTEAEILMEKRKQKAQKMIAKKPATTLNPRKVRVLQRSRNNSNTPPASICIIFESHLNGFHRCTHVPAHFMYTVILHLVAYTRAVSTLLLDEMKT